MRDTSRRRKVMGHTYGGLGFKGITDNPTPNCQLHQNHMFLARSTQLDGCVGISNHMSSQIL